MPLPLHEQLCTRLWAPQQQFHHWPGQASCAEGLLFLTLSYSTKLPYSPGSLLMHQISQTVLCSHTYLSEHESQQGLGTVWVHGMQASYS